jgi:hypothetical protein
MLTMRCFMVLSIKIYLEGILGIALFREAHKNDLLVICYRFFASASCFMDVQNYSYVNQFRKRCTGMKLEKMKSHIYIYIHGTMMNSKLQPFLLFEANCAPIMWKRKTNKKLCSKARENEILQTGWIGIEHRPVYVSLAVKKSTFFVNML